MNKISWIIAAGVALIVAIGVHFYVQASQDTLTPPTVSATDTTSSQVGALAVCTGLPINDSTIAVAYANCLGKVRGFVDSHNIIIELARASSGTNGDLEMWCVPPGVTDRQLLDSVFAWVNANPTRFDELVEMYTRSNATAAVLITSLHAAYPCKKDPV